MQVDSLGLKLDPAHASMGLLDAKISQEVWHAKYRYAGEADFSATLLRVAKAISNGDEAFQHRLTSVLLDGLFIPAGRILAGAGTTKRVTLMNCYVNGTIEDCMESIMQANTNAALTMQQGGGIGTDFSTIRPRGAILKRTGSTASGPLPFMDMWNSMGITIESAGARRGAQMGTLSDTHPDLPAFIEAKQVPGRLTNFNISVLVSDALMEAVREDEDWLLYFPEPPAERDPELVEFDFEDDEGVTQYVYSVWKAKELWEMITRATYVYSEPGVIFIDRVNELNNLHYLEDIRCTNPCGEQPLPPHGTCNLGAVNLSRMVSNPFSEDAVFNFDLLREAVQVGVRFLDNVIDITRYPLPEQEAEEKNKRRLGLGFTGLADALAQLEIRYGSRRSADMSIRIQRFICETAYAESVELAKERGEFPLFDPDQYLDGNTFASKMLPASLKEAIREHGIRNGLILTIAPTGTTSVVFGNPASGVEPVFAHETTRRVLQPDGNWKSYTELGYSARLYRKIHGDKAEFPSYMVTAENLTVAEHVLVQSSVQQWIDASVSKTINVPEETTYEEFVRVYELAYTSGCKGCTTYRPSEVRGSVLTAAGNESTAVPKGVPSVDLPARPKVLNGRTYKIKWPTRDAALYLTVNEDDQGRPFEVLIASKDGSDNEWTTALTLMITAIFRKGGDVTFLAKELQQIHSMHDGAWVDKKHYPSLPAYIGHLIETHLKKGPVDNSLTTSDNAIAERCPKCKQPSIIHSEGCRKCTNCGYSECN